MAAALFAAALLPALAKADDDDFDELLDDDSHLVDELLADEQDELKPTVVDLSNHTWKEFTDHYMKGIVMWIHDDPTDFFVVLSMIMLPLLIASGSASWYLLKKEQEDKGLEAPCFANSWAWDKPLGTTASYTPLGGKKKEKEKEKKKRRKDKDKDKDSSEKRSKKRDKTKDGEEGAKRRRSKKPPPLSKANPKTEEVVID